MKNTIIGYLSLLCILFLNNCNYDKGKARPEKTLETLDFENYSEPAEKMFVASSEEAEYLAAYISVQDSILYTPSEERLASILDRNMLPALKWTSGTNSALMINVGGMPIPLSVKVMPLSAIILMVPKFGDRRALTEKRRFAPVAGGMTECFNMDTPTPNGKTLLQVLRDMAYSYDQSMEFSYPPLRSGKVVQVDHEVWTEVSQDGEYGIDSFTAVQRYYGYTGEGCTEGFNENNRIKLAWVKSVGQWPSP